MTPHLFLRLTCMALLAFTTVSARAENPVPYTDESVARGAQLFQQYCTECHGKDGRALMDVISDATDLTDPEAYYNGSTQGDIFRSIHDGAGVGMPPWSFQIKDERDIWHLVNFIRSLWTTEQRSSM